MNKLPELPAIEITYKNSDFNCSFSDNYYFLTEGRKLMAEKLRYSVIIRLTKLMADDIGRNLEALDFLMLSRCVRAGSIFCIPFSRLSLGRGG